MGDEGPAAMPQARRFRQQGDGMKTFSGGLTMPALRLDNENQAPRTDAPTDPVEWIIDEHFRQRGLCHVLERVARNPRHGGNSEEIEEALDYLEDELALHVADEEEDLLPLLGRRCEIGDRIGEISVALRENHANQRELSRSVMPELRRLIAGEAFGNPVQFFRNSVRLSAMIRRHLVWENAVLVPLARKRLKHPDFPYLARKMAGRRLPPARSVKRSGAG
jgi:hemerythrin-like domain-containing protein